MTTFGWSFVEAAARLLARDEREAVLGDLVEADENAWQGLFGELCLVFRREAVLWKSWRPWLAGFGVALPSSFLLMGFSLSVSWSYLTLRGRVSDYGLWPAGGTSTCMVGKPQ